jgi:hypothetical protein
MFSVNWSDYALDLLADVVVSLDLAMQDELTTEIERLNRRLAKNPLDEGESRNGPFRLTFMGSLAVLFRVDTTRDVVEVSEVKWYGP